MAAGRAPGQLEGEVDGFAPAAAEHGAGEIAGGDLGQLGGQRRGLLGDEEEVAVVERVDSPVGGGDDPGVAPTDVERPRRGEAVEEAPTVDVLHPGAGSVGLDQVEAGGLHDPDLLRVEVLREVGEHLGSMRGGILNPWISAHGGRLGRGSLSAWSATGHGPCTLRPTSLG